MLLAIDVGNTSISFGIIKGEKLLERFSVKTFTDKSKLYSSLKKIVAQMKCKKTDIRKVIALTIDLGVI